MVRQTAIEQILKGLNDGLMRLIIRRAVEQAWKNEVLAPQRVASIDMTEEEWKIDKIAEWLSDIQVPD